MDSERRAARGGVPPPAPLNARRCDRLIRGLARRALPDPRLLTHPELKTESRANGADQSRIRLRQRIADHRRRRSQPREQLQGHLQRTCAQPTRRRMSLSPWNLAAAVPCNGYAVTISGLLDRGASRGGVTAAVVVASRQQRSFSALMSGCRSRILRDPQMCPPGSAKWAWRVPQGVSLGRLISSGRLRERYALLWPVTGVVLSVLSAWRGGRGRSALRDPRAAALLDGDLAPLGPERDPRAATRSARVAARGVSSASPRSHLCTYQ
jgi:hypothetical protein